MPSFNTSFRSCLCLLLALFSLVGAGCIKPKITVFPDASEPLKEYVLQGSSKERILVISIKGFISESGKEFSLRRKPGTLQEVVAQLKKAEKDGNIKAVILKIDSRGGSVTASDMLFHEIAAFKERTRVKVVAVIMGIAASGGYYIALPADCIVAHPTSITGSVGVIFLRPNVSGLMDKIGLSVETDKSGKNKDMGSPFRKATKDEEKIVQEMIDGMAARFLDLVVAHRKLSDKAKADVATARIYVAADALRLGLIDRIGYLDDVLRTTAQMAGLGEDPSIVVYRRAEIHDDTYYNSSSMRPSDMPQINLIDLGLSEAVPPLLSGFYYLWLPGGPE